MAIMLNVFEVISSLFNMQLPIQWIVFITKEVGVHATLW